MTHADNDHNVDIYARLPKSVFDEYMSAFGLVNCPDVERLWPKIARAQSMLEIGAGYGRVIERLLKNGFNGEITAIEREQKCAEHLQHKFGTRIEIVEQDFFSVTTNSSFDAILWLWAGLAETAQQKQGEAVKKILSWLKPKGIAVFECPRPDAIFMNAEMNGQHAKLKTDYGVLEVYTPTHSQVAEYAGDMGTVESEEYETETEECRMLYFVTRNSQIE